MHVLNFAPAKAVINIEAGFQDGTAKGVYCVSRTVMCAEVRAFIRVSERHIFNPNIPAQCLDEYAGLCEADFDDDSYFDCLAAVFPDSGLTVRCDLDGRASFVFLPAL